MNLWWINLPYACAGIFVSKEGIVVQTAPILSWMQGKQFTVVQQWIHRKKGEAVEVGSDM